MLSRNQPTRTCQHSRQHLGPTKTHPVGFACTCSEFAAAFCSWKHESCLSCDSGAQPGPSLGRHSWIQISLSTNWLNIRENVFSETNKPLGRAARSQLPAPSPGAHSPAPPPPCPLSRAQTCAPAALRRLGCRPRLRAPVSEGTESRQSPLRSARRPRPPTVRAARQPQPPAYVWQCMRGAPGTTQHTPTQPSPATLPHGELPQGAARMPRSCAGALRGRRAPR